MTTSPQLSDRRALLPWYLIEFLNSYAATLFCAGCYDFAGEVLDQPPSVRLWMSAAWGFAYIFIALMAGRLSEKLGPRRVVGLMVMLCIFTPLLGLLAYYTKSVWVLAAVMLPFNITSSTIWPALESAITRTPAKMPLSTRMAIYNLSWGSAGFVAFFTRGALFKIDWSMVFIATSIASLISLLVFLKFAIPAHMISADHVPAEADHETAHDTPALQARAKTLLHMAWVGNALAYVAINVLIPVQYRIGTLGGLSDPALIGFITSIWGFSRFAGFAVTWRWHGWHYKIRWLLGSQIALAVSFTLMLFFHDPIIFAGLQVLFGLSTAIVYSCSLYYAMHVSDGGGEHAGIHEALIGLGIAIGPAVGAIAGGSDFGAEALRKIAIGVSGVMILGILTQIVMVTRGRAAKKVLP